MSNTDASYNPPENASQPTQEAHAPFPWQRFLLSVLFGVFAWFAFWFTIVLAIAFWVIVAIRREPHPEFKQFVSGFARYVGQCLAYIVMLTDEKPFPFGPLPRGD